MPSINDLFNNVTVRKTLLTLRLPIAIGMALIFILDIDPEWFWPGFSISATGLWLQLWTFGCIDTRRRLAVNGPYMFVRNPMYMARYLLMAGLIVTTGEPWILLVFTPLYYLYMANRVEREEPVLLETFDEEYREYCAHVPRFVPRLTGYQRGRFAVFSMHNFRRQHGLSNLSAFSLYYAADYFTTFHTVAPLFS